jgi:ArsR family transcriptional regulator
MMMPESMTRIEREKLAAYMKALGHPVRVQIMEILGNTGECISGDISDRLPVAASTTSQHLSVLKSSGLITGTVDGPRRCYCINQELLGKARNLLAKLQACC